MTTATNSASEAGAEREIARETGGTDDLTGRTAVEIGDRLETMTIIDSTDRTATTEEDPLTITRTDPMTHVAAMITNRIGLTILVVVTITNRTSPTRLVAQMTVNKTDPTMFDVKTTKTNPMMFDERKTKTDPGRREKKEMKEVGGIEIENLDGVPQKRQSPLALVTMIRHKSPAK